MSVNHYNYDFREEVSLAHYLQDQGWDVWIPSLRGDVRSEAPSRHARTRYGFAEHAVLDVPAALDAIRAHTGEDRLYWVGHSMGGMLLYTQLASNPEGLAAGVSVCGPAALDDLNGWHRFAERASAIAPNHGKSPNKGLMRLASALGLPTPVLAIFANPDNVEVEMMKGIGREGIEDQSYRTSREVGDWIEAGALVSPTGEPWTARAEVPLLVLGAPLDHIAPPQNVEAACALSDDCTYVLLAQSEGFAEDYGHIDPMVGKNVRDEVYPLVGDFLLDKLIAEELE